MPKYHQAQHLLSAHPRATKHHWLISPAWRYALATFNLLEEERRRSLEQTGKLDDAEESSALR